MTDPMSGPDAATGQMAAEVECSLSQRVDGKKHTWQFMGDDPYVKCHWCGQIQDALSGRIIVPGRARSAGDGTEGEAGV